jgi:hypothetical protein
MFPFFHILSFVFVEFCMARVAFCLSGFVQLNVRVYQFSLLKFELKSVPVDHRLQREFKNDVIAAYTIMPSPISPNCTP